MTYFDLAYEFHKHKLIKFCVLDWDDIGDHELVGEFETTFAEIMMSPKQTLISELRLGEKRNRGMLTVQADQVKKCVDEAKLTFSGQLKSQKFLCLGSDNPYLIIERSRMLENEDLSFESKKKKLKSNWGATVDDISNVTDWVRVYKTNFIFDTCNPIWDPFSIKMSNLCNSNKKLPLKLSVHNFKNYGTHYCYGSVITSLREIEMG